MAKLIIENLTLEQAEQLAHWYEGQGEQDADCWFECNDDCQGIKTPYTDMSHKPSWIDIDKKNETVTIYCK